MSQRSWLISTGKQFFYLEVLQVTFHEYAAGEKFCSRVCRFCLHYPKLLIMCTLQFFVSLLPSCISFVWIKSLRARTALCVGSMTRVESVLRHAPCVTELDNDVFCDVIREKKVDEECKGVSMEG